MYERSGSDRGAVIVVPVDQKTGRMILVMERSKPEPHYWKFPGGSIDQGDVDPKRPHDTLRAAHNAARREVKEETGLAVEILYLGSRTKGSHTQYIFVGLGDVGHICEMGAEGEIPRVFSAEQTRDLTNFMPSHKAILEMALKRIMT